MARFAKHKAFPALLRGMALILTCLMCLGSSTGYVPQPSIHYTPPPWVGQVTGGDIAAALLHPITGTWHVMPLSHVGWAHCSTEDLVSWHYDGSAARMESGGLIFDLQQQRTYAFANTPTVAISTNDTNLRGFGNRTTLFSSEDPLNDGMGCWDPVMWYDERSSVYYAATACGHCDPGNTPKEEGKGIHCSGGEGLELYWSSPVIAGKGSHWTRLSQPLFVESLSLVPRVGSWSRPHEFVTPDFFPLPPGGEKWGFLTTSYGDLRWTGLNSTINMSQYGDLCYDYANYFIGDRPNPGAAFHPDLSLSAPFDWSPFTPVPDVTSKNLTFATSKGMEQFGCCPKTAGNASRRVLFGWINNGWDQGGTQEADRKQPLYIGNNTLSLPRDLSVSPTGQMRQRFVPELAKLRREHTHLTARTLSRGGVGNASFVSAAAGLQIEIIARFKFTDSSVKPLGKFGILVLASASLTEYTAISFDTSRDQILLDRTHSGQSLNCDVRAGPWPAPGAREITLHAYVDHAVVEFIANATGRVGDNDPIESTAVAAWVQPKSVESKGIALFSEVDGILLQSLDVWQLQTPAHSQ